MANNNRWGDFKGALANIVAKGKVYNTYTNSYAPRGVAGTRLAAGVAGQFGPMGTIAGMVAKGINDRGNAAQAFDAGQEGWANMAKQFDQRPNPTDYIGTDTGGPGQVESQWSSLRGGLANQGGGNYGPYQGGYSFPQQPTTSGLPDTQTSYGVSLPNYGGPQGQQQPQHQPMYGAAGAGAGMGSSMGGARGAYSQGGHTGEAARGMFESMSDASRFNTNFDFSGMDRNS